MADEPSTSSSIEVDAAAAYFGVTESSDVLHAMMAMSRDDAMVKFFDYLSDIVLQPGDFNFEAASERMSCEGGEIYYLVAGHLGLMSMPDPLLEALGQPTSMGEVTGSPVTSLTAEQTKALQQLSDPMRMIKIFAVAHMTGGASEVIRYLQNLESMMSDVANNAPALTLVNNELGASMDVGGHVLPIPALASGDAAAATIESLPQPEASPTPAPTPSPPPIEPRPTASVQPETKVPLPGAGVTPVASATPSPAPDSRPAVALPNVPEAVEAAQSVNFENEKQVQRAAQDAFAGAFDINMGQPESSTEGPTSAPAETQEIEEEFVSAAEHFIAADGDGSGELSIEELAQATATTIDEAKVLHAEADTDGDGSVTLSEFMASSAAQKTDGLPRPVAPVRKPLGGAAKAAPNPQPSPNPTPQQQGWNQPQPQSWQQQPQQAQRPVQGWQQPQQGWQQPPTQGWPQPQAPMVQPTIRSGVHCRGCGIGLDPYWRFCPVCGAQNLGY